jgi:hypothetical protein
VPFGAPEVHGVVRGDDVAEALCHGEERSDVAIWIASPAARNDPPIGHGEGRANDPFSPTERRMGWGADREETFMPIGAPEAHSASRRDDSGGGVRA